MAFNNVDMCMSCGIVVEKGKKCPKCKEKLSRIDSRVFQAIVNLRRKGYVPVNVKRIGSSKSKAVKVWFEGYSAGRGCHNNMELGYENGFATCSTKSWGSYDPYSVVLKWSIEADDISDRVPFNRDLCKRCTKQDDAKWYGGECKCPKMLVDGNAEFVHGFPEKCVYLVEQNVTAEDIKTKFLAGIRKRLET